MPLAPVTSSCQALFKYESVYAFRLNDSEGRRRGRTEAIRSAAIPGPRVLPAPQAVLQPGHAAGATGAEPAAGSWAAGVIVIVVGVVFLAKNPGWFGPDWAFDNWWALFILIPTFGSFGGAWRAYQREWPAG